MKRNLVLVHQLIHTYNGGMIRRKNFYSDLRIARDVIASRAAVEHQRFENVFPDAERIPLVDRGVVNEQLVSDLVNTHILTMN
jgi:hypothetical protein